jgi:hypothetical protein
MKYLLDKISKNPIVLLTCGLIVVLEIILLSLGQTARWDILQHLQMADRFELNGTIYPNYNDQILTGVSVYFPGLSFLTILLKTIVPDNQLLLIMQFLACTVVIVFFFIQEYIAKSFTNNLTFPFFFYAALIAFIFFNSDWLIYATEFKPDTIAYCFGCLGIIISGVDKQVHKSMFSFVLGIIITGVGIIFKQQYIFFLSGMIVFTLFKKDKMTRIFVFFSVLISISIIVMLGFNKNVFFWTIYVFKDDGLMSMQSWLKDHIHIFLKYILGFLALMFLYRLKLLIIPKNTYNYLRDKLSNNIWVLIMIFVFFGALISSFKKGGNPGNTAFGLIVLLPLFVYIIQNLNLRYLSLFLILILIFKVPYIMLMSINKYKDSLDFANKSNEVIHLNNLKILTGDNLYFVARNYRGSNLIQSYWTHTLKDNSDFDKQLESVAYKTKFDFLIVENLPSNMNFIRNSKKYKILFENNIGIIAISNALVRRNDILDQRKL